MEKYFQAVVNKTHHFDLNEKEAIPFKRESDSKIHAIDEHETIKADLISADFSEKKYTIRINSSYYEVELNNELDILIEEMGLTKETNSVQTDLVAPMPGLIVDVLTKPGAQVHVGDGLLVLEAMKMENTLTASRDGIVKSISVKKSDTVDKGMVLIEFEKDENNQ
jgi:acetyl/propionyl-CoA carboxylase alpha subunit